MMFKKIFQSPGGREKDRPEVRERTKKQLRRPQVQAPAGQADPQAREGFEPSSSGSVDQPRLVRQRATLPVRGVLHRRRQHFIDGLRQRKFL